MVNQVLTDLLTYMFSTGLLIFCLIVGLNFITKGFFLVYLKVKASRGGKILMSIRSVSDVYYRAAKVSEAGLSWKNRDKKDCLDVSVPPQYIYTTLGVQAVDYDEVKKGFWRHSAESVDAFVAGNDPVVVDSIVKRAILSPEDKSLLVKVLIFFVMCAILYALFQGYFTYVTYKAVLTLKSVGSVVI